MFDVSMNVVSANSSARYPPDRHDRKRGHAEGPEVVTAIRQGAHGRKEWFIHSPGSRLALAGSFGAP